MWFLRTLWMASGDVLEGWRSSEAPGCVLISIIASPVSKEPYVATFPACLESGCCDICKL